MYIFFTGRYYYFILLLYYFFFVSIIHVTRAADCRRFPLNVTIIIETAAASFNLFYRFNDDYGVTKILSTRANVLFDLYAIIYARIPHL